MGMGRKLWVLPEIPASYKNYGLRIIGKNYSLRRMNWTKISNSGSASFLYRLSKEQGLRSEWGISFMSYELGFMIYVLRFTGRVWCFYEFQSRSEASRRGGNPNQLRGSFTLYCSLYWSHTTNNNKQAYDK